MIAAKKPLSKDGKVQQEQARRPAGNESSTAFG
jgi:hypothetical protein